MPIYPLKNPGEIGIISDIDPSELPDNAFSSGNNIRFIAREVRKMTGHQQVFGTVNATPYWLLNVQTPTDSYWVYPGLTEINTTDGTTHFNLTRTDTSSPYLISAISIGDPTWITLTTVHGWSAGKNITLTSVVGNTPDINGDWTILSEVGNKFSIDVNTTSDGSGGSAYVEDPYAADADINWNGGVIGGIPVVNNGVDDPQMWNPVATSNFFESLTYNTANSWADMSYTAKVIRVFRDFLIALDVTKSGTRYSRMVKWSTTAQANAVPTTWDETDDTEDAGEYELAQTTSDIIDGLALRDTFIIYKDDSTWGMVYTGGEDIFRFYPIFGDFGILSRRCVQEFDGKHFVVGNGDVVVHDGTNKESVITDRRRDELFDAIDSTNYQRTFVVANHPKKEMWICYPSSGATLPDKAMVWNWRYNTWGDRDLPSAAHIEYGIINDSGEATAWDSDSAVWDSDTQVWDTKTYNPSDRRLLMAATNLYEADSTTQFDGSNFDTKIERTGLHFGDPEKIKTVNGLWLRTRGTATLTVTLGYQMCPNSAVTWNGSQTYTCGSNIKIGSRATGRYIAYKIESSGVGDWEVLGLLFDVTVRGQN